MVEIGAVLHSLVRAEICQISTWRTHFLSESGACQSVNRGDYNFILSFKEQDFTLTNVVAT